MSNLTRFEQNGLELIIDTSTGEVFANQNAIARMCKVSKQAISKWVGVNQIESKTSEVLTKTGVQGVNLYSEDAIYQALAKYNPELLTQCAKAGLRIYLHGLAGYKYQVVEEQSKTTPLDVDQKQIQLASTAIDIIFENLDLEPALLSGIKLNAVQSMYPDLSPHLEGSRQYLITSTANEEQLLTVTEIGKRCAPVLSARKVNSLLIHLGYQIKNPNKKGMKDATYIPTEIGKEFCDFVLATGKKGDSTTYNQLRWYESIVSVIDKA